MSLSSSDLRASLLPPEPQTGWSAVWATVTRSSPALLVRPDGQTETVPATGLGSYTEGERVWCLITGSPTTHRRTVTVVGALEDGGDVAGDAYIDGALETTGALNVGGDADITGSLKFGLEQLTTENLNDITKGGFYRQSLNVNATPERNYPVKYVGLLEVFESDNMIWQRYTLYNNSGGGAGVYNRRRYEGTWYAWEELQKVAEPVSTALTLKNGWQAYGSSYQSPEYEVFPDGRVQLHGMLLPGTKTNNTVIATVPASLAPSNRRVFVTGAGQLGAGRVDVKATGEIVLSVFGSTAELANLSWLSLENVSW